MNKIYYFFFKKLLKFFSFGVVIKSGRNFFGRICVRHKGGGCKRKGYKIDRYRLLNNFGVILKIFEDFYHTGYLGMIFYENGLSSIILLSEGVLKFSRIFSGNLFISYDSFFSKVGSTQILSKINLFDIISSIEFYQNSGACLVRSAGSFTKIIHRDTEKSLLKLSSGWQISISNHSLGTFGLVSNPTYKFISIKKAGIVRYKGIRPTVRGVIQNPCDHPHGGGEGRGSPPVVQVSPWGWFCKGTPTKNRKKDRLRRKLFKILKD